MPISGFGADIPRGTSGDAGVVSLRIDGHEIRAIKEFTYSNHFLTPTDPFRMSLMANRLDKATEALLKAGNLVEIWIDEVLQFSGYLDVFDRKIDRHTGTTIEIEGRDTMSPVVDSQIDPDHHYPDKTPLEQLLNDLLVTMFGFEDVDTSNVDNVEVAANLALKQKRGRGKPKRHRRKTKSSAGAHVKQLPLPKCKPEHNDTFYQFLSRILNRLGLWFWPSVDGKKIIVGAPNYDQEPIAQLRRTYDGLNNNITSGGIKIDTVGQPSFIYARGNIPPTTRESSVTRVVIDNTIAQLASPTPSLGEAFRNSAGTKDQIQAALLGQPPDFSPPPPKQSLAMTAFRYSRTQGGNVNSTDANGVAVDGKGVGGLRTEAGTYSEAAARASPIYEKIFKNVVKIPAKPISVPNMFASKKARPIYLRDKNSHTIEQLIRFAKRQMSLWVRKAFVATYTFQGFYLDGVIPQPDTIINVIDEACGFEGNLWVLARTIRQSRSGGTSTTLELLVPGALSF